MEANFGKDSEQVIVIEQQHLSLGGKVVLLKSVLHAPPIYFISFFKASMGVIQAIEALFGQFLWGEGRTKIHWVACQKIRKDKSEGGSGLKNLKAFNFGLLGK